MTALRINQSRSFVLLFIFGILLVIFPFAVDEITWDEFGECLFSWVPAHPPQGLKDLFSLAFMPFLVLHRFSFMVGTGIIFVCASWFSSQLHKPIISSVLLIPLLCDAYVFSQALPFLAVPSGTSIRPMGWTFFTFFLALGATVFGLIHVSQLRSQQSKFFCNVGILLSLLPIPIAMLSLKLMAAIKGFELEP